MDNPITDLVDIPVVPYLDISHAASTYGRIWYKKYQWPVLTTGFAIVTIVILSYFVFGFSETWRWFALLSLCGYGLSIALVIHSGGKVYFFRSIAEEWKWVYKPGVSDINLHTTLLRTGHSHRLSDVLEGKWKDHPALIGNFSYTVGHGKTSTTYECAMAKMDAGVPLPHVLLSVKRDRYDNHILRGINLVSVPIESLRTERRGLYTKQKLEIEALQLFTPARISEIELYWPNYNFELVGQEIYVFGSSALHSRAQIQELFSLIQYIVQELVPPLRQMRGSVQAMYEAMRPKVKP